MMESTSWLMTSKYNVIAFFSMSYHQQYGRHIMISRECNDLKKHAYLLCSHTKGDMGSILMLCNAAMQEKW